MKEFLSYLKYNKYDHKKYEVKKTDYKYLVTGASGNIGAICS